MPSRTWKPFCRERRLHPPRPDLHPRTKKKTLSHYATRSCIAFACVGCRETTVQGMSLIEGKGRVVVGGAPYEAPRRAPGTSVRRAKTNISGLPATVSTCTQKRSVSRSLQVGTFPVPSIRIRVSGHLPDEYSKKERYHLYSSRLLSQASHMPCLLVWLMFAAVLVLNF